MKSSIAAARSWPSKRRSDRDTAICKTSAWRSRIGPPKSKSWRAKQMTGGAREGSGRKRVNIDLEQLEKLCALQCTDEELAAYFGVSPRTIERRKNQPAFAEAI